jgi:hypothetical protein
MKLTDRILALHDGIREVLILEDRSGHLVVAEEASKGQPMFLTRSIDRMTINGIVAPQLILGAAEQFTKSPGSLRFVGIMYEEAGIIFASLPEDRLLAISTDARSLSAGMQAVNDALPSLTKSFEGGKSGSVKSALDAGETAKAYVAKTTGSSTTRVDEITYDPHNQRWEVQGSYRPWPLSLSKRYQVEFEEEELVGFKTYSPSYMLILAEWLAFLAALGLFGWLVYSALR